MKYRTLAGENVSVLGFGCMRFPTTSKNAEDLDIEKSTAMLRYAAENGVNYFDTAYVYHGGKSESFIGEALKPYRDKINFATKCPTWEVKCEEDFDRILTEQLERLQTDHIDFYLMHALDKDRFENIVLKFNLIDKINKAKAEGKIRHIGFSFHDDNAVFHQIMDDFDGWDMAQIQFNYLDDEHQATEEGLRYAGKRGVPVVVMEPLRGGALANPPENVKAHMAKDGGRRSAAEWAFAYAADYPEVAVILSGMSNETQLEDNLRIFDRLAPGCLTDAEREQIKGFKQAYLSRMKVGCTGCSYCVPCPQDVRIPAIFRAYNEASMFDHPEAFRSRYAGMIENGGDASRCVGCGRCEKLCPQHLPIPELLAKIDAEYKG